MSRLRTHRLRLGGVLAGVAIAAFAASPSQAQPAGRGQAASQGTEANCDRCEDLPRLYRELLEQEFLRAKFESWIRQAYYPASIESVQAAAVAALNAAMQGDLYGVLRPPSSSGGSGVGTAAPAFGTNVGDSKCALVEFVTVVDPHDSTKKTVVEQPTTPAGIRAKLCKPLAEAVIKHEGHHVESCHAAWRAGDKNVTTVEWFVKNDVESYQAGVRVLRDAISDLSGHCGWTGSTSEFKPDGTRVVPTPERITELATATKTKASALRRSSRR